MLEQCPPDRGRCFNPDKKFPPLFIPVFVSSGMICGDSQDIVIVEETRATDVRLQMGILTDMMQEENTDISVATDDTLKARPMAPAVRLIFHKVFRSTYWLRKSILYFFISLIIYCHTFLAPVSNYQTINHRAKPADTSK